MSSFWSVLLAFFVNATHLLSTHPFAVLACLPGLIAIVNMVSLNLKFTTAREEIRSIEEAWPSRQGAQRRQLDKHKPSWAYTLWGALALSVVFGIVAALGGEGKPQMPLITDFGAAAARRVVSPVTNPGGKSTAAETAKAPTVNTQIVDQDKDKDREKESIGPLAGVIYAGYGAYIYTLLLLVSRLNSAALTGKFLAVSAVRSALTLVLGFTAVDTNIFAGLSPNQGLFVLFFCGLFPSWALDLLRQKAQEIFKPKIAGNVPLSLAMLDGLDDGIADYLAENGLWDVEHLATADPFVLALRTLLPPRRILDWMNQAILCGYLRENVAHFRAYGLRGASHYAGVYQDAMGLWSRPATAEEIPHRAGLQQRAATLIKTLAQKTSLPEEALLVIGRNLFEDADVRFIWRLWASDSSASAPPPEAPVEART